MGPETPFDLADPATMPLPGALRAVTREIAGSVLLRLSAGPHRSNRHDTIAGLWFFRTAEDAESVEQFCYDLLKGAHFHVNRDGFSNFPLIHAANLVSQAMQQANVYALPKPRKPFERESQKPWTRARIGRLGYLIGRGLEAKEVAEDPDIKSNAANVYRQASRFGLSFQETPRGQLSVRLPRDDLLRFERLAAARNVTPDVLLRRLAEAADRLAPMLFLDAKSDMVSS